MASRTPECEKMEGVKVGQRIADEHVKFSLGHVPPKRCSSCFRHVKRRILVKDVKVTRKSY